MLTDPMFWACLMAAILIGLAFIGGVFYERSHAPDMMGDIVDFHKRFGLEYRGGPRILPLDLSNFRIDFMQEELNEYREAEVRMMEVLSEHKIFGVLNDTADSVDALLEDELDALVDLIYVTLGTAYLQFGPSVFNEAWCRVHDKNMQKVRKARAAEGHIDSGREATYDVVKPEGWTPPSHIDLIQRRHRWTV